MSTATQAPKPSSGSGRVVRQAPIRHRSSSTTKRTSLLSTFTPDERRAFLQEQLDQSCLFRQIAAARNGVPGVIGRNILGPQPTETEIREEAAEQGISVDDVRRREDLARREASVEVRQEVLRRQEAELAKQSTTAAVTPAPPPQATVEEEPDAFIDADEASRLEELARKEADLEVREQDMAARIGQRTREEEAAAADQRRHDELRAAEQANEDARRQQAAMDREQAIKDEEQRRLDDEARRRREEDAQWNASERDKEESHKLRMLELDAERLKLNRLDRPQPPTVKLPGDDHVKQSSNPPRNEPDTKESTGGWKKPAAIGAATTAGAAGLVGLAIWLASGDKGKDTPVDPSNGTSMSQTDRETIGILNSQGLAAPRTPLGESILQAFEKDPTLRERFMRDVERTLLDNKDEPAAQNRPTEAQPEQEAPMEEEGAPQIDTGADAQGGPDA